MTISAGIISGVPGLESSYESWLMLRRSSTGTVCGGLFVGFMELSSSLALSDGVSYAASAVFDVQGLAT